jgi:hypothetical protein
VIFPNDLPSSLLVQAIGVSTGQQDSAGEGPLKSLKGKSMGKGGF